MGALFFMQKKAPRKWQNKLGANVVAKRKIET
jgi:hypothetical protein